MSQSIDPVLMAARIRKSKSGLFATPDNINEIIKEMEETGLGAAIPYIFMATNGCLEKVAQHFDKLGEEG